MEIIIHQAILHVLDTTMDAPVLSGSGMEMTAEKTAYFQYHIEKLLASDDIRQCRPLPDSAFKNELEHNHDFVDLSCRIAGVLFDYMHAHTTIPGADLAVVDFTRDGEPWLGILKLNYKNGYTHYTENVEGAPVNSIIQQRACLPSQSGKVEEGALVNLTDYSMKLLEKKFDIDGHKGFYLSTVVFQYTTAQPEKKKLQAIQEAAVQAVQENYADQPHVEAQVAMLIANQAADNDNQVSIQQVRQQLEEEYPLAAVPFDDYVEKSDVLEAPEQPVTVTPARIRRMESRSIHTANGIEVKIPTELLNSDNEVEFLHSDDGSISLLIKKCDPVRNDLKLSPRTDRAPTISAESLFSYLQKAEKSADFPTFLFFTGRSRNGKQQKSHRFCISASTMASYWSGRRGSNSLPPPWQGGALPDELRPHIGNPAGFP